MLPSRRFSRRACIAEPTPFAINGVAINGDGQCAYGGRPTISCASCAGISDSKRHEGVAGAPGAVRSLSEVQRGHRSLSEPVQLFLLSLLRTGAGTGEQQGAFWEGPQNQRITREFPGRRTGE